MVLPRLTEALDVDSEARPPLLPLTVLATLEPEEPTCFVVASAARSFSASASRAKKYTTGARQGRGRKQWCIMMCDAVCAPVNHPYYCEPCTAKCVSVAATQHALPCMPHGYAMPA